MRFHTSHVNNLIDLTKLFAHIAVGWFGTFNVAITHMAMNHTLSPTVSHDCIVLSHLVAPTLFCLGILSRQVANDFVVVMGSEVT